jgi:hypothetical protein
MPPNKNTHTHRTNYLDQVIRIAQSPDHSWSYAIHSHDFQILSQKTGFINYTQALNHAKVEVETFLANAPIIGHP